MPLRRKLLLPVVISFLGAILIFNGGCQELVNQRSSSALAASEKALSDHYMLGLSAYFSGDFDTAVTTFAIIGEQTTDPLLKRRAQFGLACTRLMTAGTPDEFALAMADWDAWVHLAPQNWATENPLMFVPIVNQKLVVPETSKVVDQESAEQTAPNGTTWQVLNLQWELQHTRAQLEKAGQQLTDRQQTIQALKQEIVALQEQIKAIELIDQKIQEKKKAIPSTD